MSSLLRTIDRIVQLELNEVSRRAIDQLIRRGELPTFRRISQSWNYVETTSESVYEHIEPWIQWVTAHTGKSFAEHNVYRLGNAPEDLQAIQIWEQLEQAGRASLVFGCMNAKRGTFSNGIFFPDPWAKRNETHPEELRPIWQAIAGRVQKHATTELGVSDLVDLARRLLALGLDPRLAARIAAQLAHQRFDRRVHWRLALLFDEFLADLFLRQARAKRYAWNTCFLNCVAHYQHHHWRLFDPAVFPVEIATPDARPTDNPMLEGYRAYDRILRRTIERLDDGRTAFIVLSGLSQVPFTDADANGGKFYYRLRDHEAFARKIGLNARSIFPMMSRDWQAVFADANGLARARELLEGLSVRGRPLFAVRDAGENTLFVETAYEEGTTQAPVDGAPGRLTVEGEFVAIAIKSGHHTGVGSLWSSIPLEFTSARPPLAELVAVTTRALVPAAPAN
jgi:hypothetical protein